MSPATYSFNIDAPPSKLLEIARTDLKRIAGATSQPELLKWQVRLYDFVLSKPDKDALARAYLEAKNGRRHATFRAGLIAGAKACGFEEPMPPPEGA